MKYVPNDSLLGSIQQCHKEVKDQPDHITGQLFAIFADLAARQETRNAKGL